MNFFFSLDCFPDSRQFSLVSSFPVPPPLFLSLTRSPRCTAATTSTLSLERPCHRCHDGLTAAFIRRLASPSPLLFFLSRTPPSRGCPPFLESLLRSVEHFPFRMGLIFLMVHSPLPSFSCNWALFDRDSRRAEFSPLFSIPRCFLSPPKTASGHHFSFPFFLSGASSSGSKSPPTRS